jgi:diguanylate cyclase (GGDEF)-like protein
VLRAIGALLGRLLRTEDVVARYGGEELAVICHGVDSRDAEILAERLRSGITALAVPWPGGDVHVTTSIGIALAREGSGLDTPERVIARADRSLYAAKSAGRNMVASTP